MATTLYGGLTPADAPLLLRKVVNQTTDRILTAADSGTVFSNAGAGSSVTFTLPAATSSAGVNYEFYVDAGQNIVIQAVGSDVIYVRAVGSNAGGTQTSGVGGLSLTLIAFGGLARWATMAVVDNVTLTGWTAG